jgi:hypothetical protein
MGSMMVVIASIKVKMTTPLLAAIYLIQRGQYEGYAKMLPLT